MVNLSGRVSRLRRSAAVSPLAPWPLTALSVAALLLGGCSSPRASAPGNGPQELLLVSYAVTKNAYDRILPRFEADWKAKTGQDLKVRASFGGSASQTRAVIDGLEADLAALALAGDVYKLQQAGLVNPGWQKELPHDSSVTESAVAFITRPGNPKQIRNWSDLNKSSVRVVTANPKTSGGARWNFLGLWGSVIKTGGSEAEARRFVSSVYQRVDNLPKDAREASDAFLKRGQGDVLLTYENEAILAGKESEKQGAVVVPSLNIRIEAPVAVVDRNVDKHGSRKAAEALATYLQGAEAQRIFAEEGFRPINPAIRQQVEGRFARVSTWFSVKDFGGWETVDRTFFARNGLWDQLFRNRR